MRLLWFHACMNICYAFLVPCVELPRAATVRFPFSPRAARVAGRHGPPKKVRPFPGIRKATTAMP
nr:MAG TPA: hypothetical protein [Caudoviricetes sp.]